MYSEKKTITASDVKVEVEKFRNLGSILNRKLEVQRENVSMNYHAKEK